MNIKGGGITYVNDHSADEFKMFRGGLRQPAAGQDKLIHNMPITPRAYHDKMSYERGLIQHARAPSTQLFNFHFLYGGLKTNIERHLYQHVYRRILRPFWLPGLIYYGLGGMTQRMYDNAAYDYFYFSG